MVNYGGVLMFFSEKELKIAEDLAWKMQFQTHIVFI